MQKICRTCKKICRIGKKICKICSKICWICKICRRKIDMLPAHNFIFSIFYILLHAKYAEYTRWSIFLHISVNLYIFSMLNCIQLHIILRILHILHIAICGICRIYTVKYFLHICFAYSAYYIAYNMLNMQNNMQAWIPICRILHRVYSAYSTYICTPHFADALGADHRIPCHKWDNKKNNENNSVIIVI